MEGLERLSNKPVSADIDAYAYARQLFPDISDALIERNLNEFSYAKDVLKKCNKACMSAEMCKELANTGTMQPVIELMPNGWVRMSWMKCDKSKVDLRIR